MSASQFGSFDGLDNRREIMRLLVRLGDGLSSDQGAARRASFLRALIDLSGNGFAGRLPTVTSCNAVEAYHLFIAITGCLGVPIETAARRLEQEVARR